MNKKNKLALAACSGMSPYGLISRITSADIVEETDNTISLCMGATSADRIGFKSLIKKYPIITIKGCDGDCALKILEQKGVKSIMNINIMEELNKKNLKPTDVSRLDDNGELCVEYIKNKIKNKLKRIENK
ncbi:MAG: putative zinc-binding protein [Methanobacterium sp.]|uniref:putative zinc-binding protein n=1 Tax=Methanobacterium sp. TaxID=2164 RepID=UPI003C78A12C